FRTLLGPFVRDHNSKTPVSVTRVFSKIGFGFEALLFRTAVHEDLDGAPRSFAPLSAPAPRNVRNREEACLRSTTSTTLPALTYLRSFTPWTIRTRQKIRGSGRAWRP